MTMHIELGDAIVGETDAIAGLQRRNTFVRQAMLDAVDRRRRTRRMPEAAGILRDSEHEWDDDPAAWVGHHRGGGLRHVG